MKYLITAIAAVVLVGCVNGNPEADSQLLSAAYMGDMELAKKALAVGANVNCRNPLGSTPMHNASSKGHNEIIELLITKGADINPEKPFMGGPLTPFDLAAEKETAALLRKHGAKTAEELKAAGPIVEVTKSASSAVRAPDDSIKKTIYEAIKKENITAIKQHLNSGADVNQKCDQMRWTPLHYAASRGNKEITELLIDKGANVNAKDERRTTPLHRAALTGKKEVAKLLIANGADVSAMTQLPPGQRLVGNLRGMTPLDMVTLGNRTRPSDKYKQITDLLRKHGAKTAEELKAAGN